MKREILLLGNEELYDISAPVSREELPELISCVKDMHDTLMEYRFRYGAGRAIAAPQIGVKKRLIYMHVDKPIVFINPELELLGEADMRVMDDCMSFPGLYVNVMRHRQCRVSYLNMDWEACQLEFSGDLSELIQHEYDHLNGVLATMRAIDDKAFYYTGDARGAY